jgi:uncharacterized damage-inducible protein DinB
MNELLDQLRFPIGRYMKPENITKAIFDESLAVLGGFPGKLAEAVKGLSNEQLETTYRDGGWTLKQVVHHLADSHLNSYIRCRLALTEVNPTIKPYDESVWAALWDARNADISLSITLLMALHARWILLLGRCTESDLLKTFYHPEQDRQFSVREIVYLYAWHCRHHLAHITGCRQRNGW